MGSHRHSRCVSPCAQVAGNGYVFGMYAAVSWPKQPKEYLSLTVADPSGASFLCSLYNAYDRPFRLSLRNRRTALSVSYRGVNLGADAQARDLQVQGANLTLLSGAANQPNG